MTYISGTTMFFTHYGNGNELDMGRLRVADDADWGGDLENRRSKTGYIIAVNTTLIYSKRKTRPSYSYHLVNRSISIYLPT